MRVETPLAHISVMAPASAKSVPGRLSMMPSGKYVPSRGFGMCGFILPTRVSRVRCSR